MYAFDTRIYVYERLTPYGPITHTVDIFHRTIATISQGTKLLFKILLFAKFSHRKGGRSLGNNLIDN